MKTTDKLRVLKTEVAYNSKKKESSLDPAYVVEVIDEALLLIKELIEIIQEIKAALKGMKFYQVWKLIPVLKLIQAIVNRFVS